jgi:hypothetical protein
MVTYVNPRYSDETVLSEQEVKTLSTDVLDTLNADENVILLCYGDIDAWGFALNTKFIKDYVDYADLNKVRILSKTEAIIWFTFWKETYLSRFEGDPGLEEDIEEKQLLFDNCYKPIGQTVQRFTISDNVSFILY